MDIGILGNGDLAVALGRIWAARGHHVRLTGRDAGRVADAAAAVGGDAEATDPRDLSGTVDVLVVAVAFDGLREAIELLRGPQGRLSGLTIIDCTNAVDFSSGRHRLTASSAAEQIAELAPGARVVKALHLFAGGSWAAAGPTHPATVALSADPRADIDLVARLVEDLGGRAALVGDLSSARASEELAGFVMRLVAAGVNPRDAVPDVSPAV